MFCVCVEEVKSERVKVLLCQIYTSELSDSSDCWIRMVRMTLRRTDDVNVKSQPNVRQCRDYFAKFGISPNGFDGKYWRYGEFFMLIWSLPYHRHLLAIPYVHFRLSHTQFVWLSRNWSDALFSLHATIGTSY